MTGKHKDRAYEKRFSDCTFFWYLYATTVILVHIFLYMKISQTLGRVTALYIWIPCSILLTTLNFITRRTDKIKSCRRRKWTDRVGVLWISFVIISAAMLLFIHLEELILLKYIVCGKNEILFIFTTSFFITMYGFCRANKIETIEINLISPKIGKRHLRIVQLTDLHIGPWTGPLLINQVVNKINSANPDIVVVTGDLVDGHGSMQQEDMKTLRQIKSNHGVYAVTGNHDYYDDIEDSIKFMNDAGMKVLRSETVEIDGIIIVGADDRDHLIKEKWGLSPSELLVLSQAEKQKNTFLLLLRHRPIIEPGTEGHFDLQLSGHTHGGQVLPLITSRHKIGGHSSGLKKLKNGGYLYVSNGAGFVGAPLRFFAPPEITVFNLFGIEIEQNKNL